MEGKQPTMPEVAVVWAHSPITVAMVRAWIERQGYVPENVVVLHSRVDADEIPGGLRLVVPKRPDRKWLWPLLFWKAWQFWGEVRKYLAGREFVLFAPHLLMPLVRWGAGLRECARIEIFEEGALSLRPLEASLGGTSSMLRLTDRLSRLVNRGSEVPPGERIEAAWCWLPTCFPGCDFRRLLELPMEVLECEIDACVLIDPLRPEFGFDEAWVRGYQRWLTEELGRLGLGKVGAKLHPDLLRQPGLAEATLKEWAGRLGLPGLELVDQRLDLVVGGGRVMLGAYSSLLAYAARRGWDVRLYPMENRGPGRILVEQAVEALRAPAELLNGAQVQPGR